MTPVPAAMFLRWRATVLDPTIVRTASVTTAKPTARYARMSSGCWGCCCCWFIRKDMAIPAKTMSPIASAATMICTTRTTRRAYSSELKGDIASSSRSHAPLENARCDALRRVHFSLCLFLNDVRRRASVRRFPRGAWEPVNLFVCVKDRLRGHLHLIDDADDGGIHGQRFRLGGIAGARPLHAQDDLAFAGANRVDDDERSAGGLEAALVFLVDPHRFDAQSFLPDH